MVKSLAATKLDYYLAKCLIDGLLSIGDSYLTDRQTRIYEAVKRINLGNHLQRDEYLVDRIVADGFFSVFLSFCPRDKFVKCAFVQAIAEQNRAYKLEKSTS